jgi:hypothetical protein
VTNTIIEKPINVVNELGAPGLARYVARERNDDSALQQRAPLRLVR